MKKPAGSVRFRFYNPKTEKTEPTQTETNRKKPSKTGLNRFCPKKPNRKPVGLNWFRFLKKNQFGYLFLIKIKPNRKWLPLICTIFATVNGIIITWLKTFYLYDMKIIIWTWIIKIDYKIIRNLKLIIKTRKLMNNIKFINSNCWVKKNCHSVF